MLSLPLAVGIRGVTLVGFLVLAVVAHSHRSFYML